jgi:hypothetical protein
MQQVANSLGPIRWMMTRVCPAFHLREMARSAAIDPNEFVVAAADHEYARIGRQHSPRREPNRLHNMLVFRKTQSLFFVIHVSSSSSDARYL